MHTLLAQDIYELSGKKLVLDTKTVKVFDRNIKKQKSCMQYMLRTN